MATDIVARGMAADKLSKSGGTIDGDLSVTGNLNVSGTTVTTKQETLLVKNNMLITNADGLTLLGLSGIGIRSGPTNVYGLVYDQIANSVKFGIGTLDSNNNFTFNIGEGNPIAIRDDSSNLTDGCCLKWDALHNMLVDGGIALNSDIYGINRSTVLPSGTNVKLNTNLSVAGVVSLLSLLNLTQSINVGGQEVYAAAVLFEDDIPGDLGVYAVDLSTLGGSGFAIATAMTYGDSRDQYEDVLFISDISDPNNEDIIKGFIPTFVMPQEPGWLKDDFNISTQINPTVILKGQSDNIVNTYSKYISSMFGLNRSLWDAIQVMIDFNATI